MSKAREVKGLENDIALYDKQIKRHPEESNNYYIKAGALLDLAKVVEKQDSNKYLDEALKAYDEAIKLEPENTLYFVDRSKLYVQLDKIGLALEDIRKIGTLPQDDGVIGIYVKNTVEEVSKLDSIQSQVDQLVKSSKISEEEAYILCYHLKSTTSLVIEDSYYTEKGETKEDLKELLKNQMSKTIKLESIIKEIQSGQKIQGKQLVSIVEWQGETKKKLEAIENALKVFDQTALELKKKVEASVLINAKDKEEMQQHINSIARMTAKFADKEDVKKITVSLTKLIASDKMTKQLLIDLEEETERLAQHQEENEQRINKLEKAHQQFSQKVIELKDKISTDSKIAQEDKERMTQYINDIEKKMNSVAKQSDVEAITIKIDKMITPNKITEGELLVIRENIERILKKQDSSSEEIVSLQQRSVELSTESVNLKNRVEKAEAELSNKLDDYSKKLNKELGSSSLSKSDKEKVSDYYKAFISTFSSAYVTAQSVDSGLLTLKTTNMEAIGLSTLASFLPLIGDTLSSTITSANDFLASKEMKTNARKLKNLAGDNIQLSQLVGNSALQITSNKDKQEQIITVTDEVIEKESATLYEKLMAFCKKVSIEIDGKLYTQMYPTAVSKLGNKDANLLIDKLIRGEFNVNTNLENIAQQFTDQIVLSSASLDSLSDNISRVEYKIPAEVKNQVKTNSAEGLWTKEDFISLSWITSSRSTQELLSDKYLRSSVKDIADEDLNYARIALFKHICLGIHQRNNKNMKCAKEFTNSYPELIQIINEEFPDYFDDDEEIADTCAAISKANLVGKVVNESYSSSVDSNQLDFSENIDQVDLLGIR